MTAEDTRGLALPDFITASVLDQWEASAREDEASGSVWSLNPTTMLAILPVLRAALPHGPVADSRVAELEAALDNLATHHELERVAGNTHSRPNRCEFVEQARRALSDADTAGSVG